MRQNGTVYPEENVQFKRVPLIDGTFRKVSIKSIVGYCHCSKHKGYIDAALLESHDCVEKKCVYLERFEDYPFWINYMKLQKEKEHRKRAKKHRMQLQAAHKECVEREMKTMLENAQGIADRLDYPIIIIKVVPRYDTKENYEYIVNYVSDNLYDDWHLYFDLALTMGKCFGGKYILKHLKKPDGCYADIFDWENR